MTESGLFLQCLSVSAITTTIALFFCGIPICVTVWRKKSTEEISGVPFLMGLLGGSFWLRYGFLKMDMTMITVNIVGIVFFVVYCIFFLIYAKPRKFFAFELAFVCSTIGFMVVWIAYKPDIDYLGIVCMTFNIINFGAPLAGLGVVIRRRNCSTLPLPLCCANFLVSLQWFIYGMLVQDPYVLTPNGIGMCLSVVQLSLFVVFPLRENESSALEKIAAWFSGRTKELDIEKGNQTDLKHTTFMHLPAGKILSEISNNIGHFKRDNKAASFGASSRPPSYRSRSNSTGDIPATIKE